jgi:hypothetical protein
VSICLVLKKIKAILQLAALLMTTQVHLFINAVNFYCDMWPQHVHLLAPLTFTYWHWQIQVDISTSRHL